MHSSTNSGETGDSAGASRKSTSTGRPKRSSSANSEENSSTNPNNSDGNSGPRRQTRGSGNLIQQDYKGIGVPQTRGNQIKQQRKILLALRMMR